MTAPPRGSRRHRLEPLTVLVQQAFVKHLSCAKGQGMVLRGSDEDGEGPGLQGDVFLVGDTEMEMERDERYR